MVGKIMEQDVYCRHLIELVKPYTFLYHKSHNLYKNAKKRNEAWRTIQNELMNRGIEVKYGELFCLTVNFKKSFC